MCYDYLYCSIIMVYLNTTIISINILLLQCIECNFTSIQKVESYCHSKVSK